MNDHLPDRLDADAPIFVISVAAQLADMHPQTLRGYDRLGLVVPGRAKGRGRRYSLRDIANWPGMSTDRACRLLNALYLTSALMVMRSHPAAREPHNLLSRLLRRDKPRR